MSCPQVNFWLYQYQILMDAKPAQLIKEEEKRRAEYEKVGYLSFLLTLII